MIKSLILEGPEDVNYSFNHSLKRRVGVLSDCYKVLSALKAFFS